jgi:hypothetical protein
MDNKTLLFLLLFIIFIFHKKIDISKISFKKGENEISDETEHSVIGDIQKEISTLVQGIIPEEETSPVKIQKKPNNLLNTSKFGEKKDFISPKPQNTTEYRFVDENMKTAWSNVNVSQHPKYYTSDISDEKIDVGGFFDREKFFNDNTSPRSITTLPERCHVNDKNEVLCDFNNRLKMVPPKLIEDPENSGVLNSINSNIYKSIDKRKVEDINGNNYHVWEYSDEKSINGGTYFDDVRGSSENNETFLKINSIKQNYSF